MRQVRIEGVDRRRVQASTVTRLAERRRGSAAFGGHRDFAASGKLFSSTRTRTKLIASLTANSPQPERVPMTSSQPAERDELIFLPPTLSTHRHPG